MIKWIVYAIFRPSSGQRRRENRSSTAGERGQGSWVSPISRFYRFGVVQYVNYIEAK